MMFDDAKDPVDDSLWGLRAGIDTGPTPACSPGWDYNTKRAANTFPEYLAELTG